jgi:hypothetical protein
MVSNGYFAQWKQICNDKDRTLVAKVPNLLFVAAQAVSPSRWCIKKKEPVEAESAYTRKMDFYVVGSAVYLTVVLFMLPWLRGRPCLGAILAGMAAWRILDMLTYRLYFLFIKSEWTPWSERTARRSLGFALANVYEIVVAYSILYLRFGCIVKGDAPLASASEAFYYSVTTLTTLGYGDYTPGNTTSQWLVVGELGTGLLFLAIVLPGVLSSFTTWNPRRVHTAMSSKMRAAVDLYISALETMQLDRCLNPDAASAEIRKLRDFLTTLKTSTTNCYVEPNDIFLRDNSAAVKWTAEARRRDGRDVRFEGLDVIDVNEAGRVTSVRSYWDQEPILIAIGADVH